MNYSKWYGADGADVAGAAADTAAKSSGNSDAIAQGLQAALQLGAAVKSNREASGAAQSRRDRITNCGRKPLLGFGRKFRERKDAYNKCVASMGSATAKSNGGGYTPPPPPEKDNTMKWVLIGTASVLVIGITAYAILKK